MRVKEENRGRERGRRRKFFRLPPLPRPLFLRHLLDRKLIPITREHKENAGTAGYKDVRANCFCASFLRTAARANSHATSYIEGARQVLK